MGRKKDMGINVQLEDEGGGVIEAVQDPRSLTKQALIDHKESVCLRFVNPYGDAVFNQMQAPVLLSELKNAQNKKLTAEAHEHLRSVISLVERAQGQTHTYIRFVGD